MKYVQIYEKIYKKCKLCIKMEIENAVNLIISNDKEQILLIRRSDTEAVAPGTWSIPGGRVEENESNDIALQREIQEELRVTIASCSYFKTYFVKNVRAVYFYGRIDPGNIILNHEASSFFWFDKNNILDLDLAFNQKEVLSDFLEFSHV